MPETHQLLQTASVLGDIGFSISWSSTFQPNCKVVSNLPTFPWQWKTFWHESQSCKMSRFPEKSHELLGPQMNAANGGWMNTLNLSSVPYLVDHVVQGNTYMLNLPLFLLSLSYLPISLSLSPSFSPSICPCMSSLSPLPEINNR